MFKLMLKNPFPRRKASQVAPPPTETTIDYESLNPKAIFIEQTGKLVDYMQDALVREMSLQQSGQTKLIFTVKNQNFASFRSFAVALPEALKQMEARPSQIEFSNEFAEGPLYVKDLIANHLTTQLREDFKLEVIIPASAPNKSANHKTVYKKPATPVSDTLNKSCKIEARENPLVPSSRPNLVSS